MKNDPIAQSVAKKIIDRSNVGIKKYGTTLEENNVDDFLVHAQEEAMDFANYLEKLIHDKNKMRSVQPCERLHETSKTMERQQDGGIQGQKTLQTKENYMQKLKCQYNSLKYHYNLLKHKLPILGKPNFGLVKEEHSEKDDIMGVSNRFDWKVLREDGNWLPEAIAMEDEVQKGRYVETMGCTGYAAMNIIEMLAYNKYGEVWNLSDRYINKMSGTTRSGNSLRRVLDKIREVGVVNEADWAWDKDKFTWNDYYAPVACGVIKKGKRWLEQYGFGFVTVWCTRKQKVEALKYSPLYVAGYAWYREGKVYKSYGNPNHCFTVLNIDDLDENDAYDSYFPFFKRLAGDYKLYYVKRLYLNKKSGINTEFAKDLIKRGGKYVMRADNHGELYRLTEDKVEKIDVSEFYTKKLTESFLNKEIISMNESDYNRLVLTK